MKCLIIFSVLVGTLVCSIFIARKSIEKGAKPKTAVTLQILSFAVIFVATCFFTINSFKADAATKSTASTVASSASSGETMSDSEVKASVGQGMGYLAMAIVLGLASIGSGIAVAGAAPAAIGAMTEDPKTFGKSLMLVGMGEGIVIISMIVVIMVFTHLV